jgi:hypothetical protein
MISSTDAFLLLSGWKDDGCEVKALLIDFDKITRSVIEGKISNLDNARVTITSATNYMVVNLESAQFDYGDSREFGAPHDYLYSDLINSTLPSGMYFAIAVLKQKP